MSIGAPLKPFVEVTLVDYDFIDLLWTEPWSAVTIKNYTIEILNSEGVALRTEHVKAPADSYRVLNLLGNTQYSFRIRANSDAGQGTWSDLVNEQTAETS